MVISRDKEDENYQIKGTFELREVGQEKSRQSIF